MKKFTTRAVEILLIEDNRGDVLLTKEAFKGAKIKNNINVAIDGVDAMNYLLKKNEYCDASSPDIILLDLNLPKKDGKQVLLEIKQYQELKNIPVVIMTSSRSERDIVESYNLQASSYLIKPVSLENFVEVVDAIENFWFTVVVLPD